MTKKPSTVWWVLRILELYHNIRKKSVACFGSFYVARLLRYHDVHNWIRRTGWRENVQGKSPHISSENRWFPVKIFPRKPIHWYWRQFYGQDLSRSRTRVECAVLPSGWCRSPAIQGTSKLWTWHLGWPWPPVATSCFIFLLWNPSSIGMLNFMDYLPWDTTASGTVSCWLPSPWGDLSFTRYDDP